MKRTIFLSIALATVWLLWSGHFHDGFLLMLGVASVVVVACLALRMEISDDEGAPIHLGIRPFIYAAWLVKHIVVANVQVAGLILNPKLPIRPRMIKVTASQVTELGRVILANSITLTPGTVSVDMQGSLIWVHTLSFDGMEEDLFGDLDRRICQLED